MSKINNFTEGPILGPLIKFSIPILLALVLQSMYGAVDLLIVGQFGETADVSAVSTGTQIMQFVTAIIVGLSMGTTILLGQKIGQDKSDEAGEVIGSGIVMFAILSIALTVVVFFLAPAMSRLMHAPDKAFDQTVSYVQVCSLGSAFIIAYNIFGSIFRGIGDSKTPLITVAIACVVNIFGDLLLCAVFDMGAKGAAIATVFAQGLSVLFSMLFLKKHGTPFTIKKQHLHLHPVHCGQMLRLGFPIALQDGLVSISFLVILSIVNGLGLIVSAGVGVAERICGFVLLIPSSFMQSMSAFSAQNIGADKPDRAKKALFCSIAISLAFGLCIGYFSFFHGDILASIFSKDTEVISAAAEYLKAYAIDCLLTSFLFSFIGFFNGCGKTTFVMLQGIVGAFLVRIPVSFFASKIIPTSLFYIGLATPSSTVVQIILCFTALIIMNRKLKKAPLNTQ